MLLGDNNGVLKGSGRRRASMTDHKTLAKYLGRYSGLILYLKEMDEAMYAKLCAVRVHLLCPFATTGTDQVMELGVFFRRKRAP